MKQEFLPRLINPPKILNIPQWAQFTDSKQSLMVATHGLTKPLFVVVYLYQPSITATTFTYLSISKVDRNVMISRSTLAADSLRTTSLASQRTFSKMNEVGKYRVSLTPLARLLVDWSGIVLSRVILSDNLMGLESCSTLPREWRDAKRE